MNEPKTKKPLRSASSTRERLLDAAEALFADNGYNAVSMRDIARHARVNLAAAGYHFGSKESLFTESLMRQMRPLNERRMAKLAELEAEKRPPAIAEVLDTFARVMIEQAVNDQESGRRLHRALSRIFAESDKIAHAIFRKEMLPAAMRFLAAIRRACPELSASKAGMGLALYAGCVIHTLRWAVSPPVPELRGDLKVDVDTLMTSLVAFGSAGFKRLTETEKNSKKRSKT
jgi:AcrR family transcriptional regulator